MPKYYDEDFEQDWEPVILKKNTQDNSIKHEEIPFNRKITFARQKSNLSLHEFAQVLNMKINVLERIENGQEIPDKKTITKMNRILLMKFFIP